ncbi:MBL fold metallo-hydrolase [Rhodospirillaceae bacterium SYSU D60014]|uniref:MBL fold metallo-hydrolase n=1 Tax=Virgifigura deserti TaxID=2268457 RepID=UPI000E6650E1
MPVEIADHWFEIRHMGDDITLLWEPHVIPLMRCNIWHVRGRERDLMIDTGMGICSLREAARDLLDKPMIAVATHTHADHVGGHHEFDDCLVHAAEADNLQRPTERGTLVAQEIGPDKIRKLRIAGYEIGEALITALPHAGYDLSEYGVRPAKATRIVEEGSIVDTGDRRFEVLHLPGHSPGSIGLWEAATGTLFSGDAIYDGPLLDELPHSNIEDYVKTMRRLRTLPVRTVHAGHDPSFGRDRLIELVDAYLDRRAG